MIKTNKGRKRALLLGLTLVTAATIFGACSKKEARTLELSRNAEGQDFYTIKTWTKLDCTGAPFFVGDQMGFFKEEGLIVEYTGNTAVPQRIPSILHGDNDVGDAHPNEIAIAREGGATIRAIGLSIVEPPPEVTDIHLQHMWWVSGPNSDIKTPEDIIKHPGKVKIQMIARNACMDFNTDVLLERYNIPRDKIEYITMPDIEGIQSLKLGLIDIAIPHPPFFKSVEDLKGNVITTSRELRGANAGTYLYYASDDFIKKNPEAVRRFIRAIKKAERWANENPEQTAKWTEEAIGIPVLANHWYSTESAINDPFIQEWIDGAKTAGALESTAKVTVADIVTHEFDPAGRP
ncbi:ABC transporter substrate-binding protein [Treponema primitia]|uniref:ABC transporter substrate-binding protein n=1 Tax=Treponema primitia TaxID=88058 RepID=UPI00397ECE69